MLLFLRSEMMKTTKVIEVQQGHYVYTWIFVHNILLATSYSTIYCSSICLFVVMIDPLATVTGNALIENKNVLTYHLSVLVGHVILILTNQSPFLFSLFI